MSCIYIEGRYPKTALDEYGAQGSRAAAFLCFEFDAALTLPCVVERKDGLAEAHVPDLQETVRNAWINNWYVL